MLTPGIAPKSIPPITPKTKINIVIGSPKSAALPARKFSIIRTNPDLEHVLQLGVHAQHKRAEIIEW